MFGLVLVHTIPEFNSLDPKRSLSLQNTAIDEDDVRVFYAEFGDGESVFQVRQTSSIVNIHIYINVLSPSTLIVTIC